MTRSGFTDVIPVLPVHDLGTSVKYYVERLGFTFAFGDREGSPLPDSSGAPGYAGIRRDGVELHLQWQHASEFTLGTVGLAMLRIRVANADELHEEYRKTGVIDEQHEIRTTSRGTREFHVRDPDGHGLTFFQDAAQPCDHSLVP
jgi:uncharacterized glyoxalase superfamily protein PhnB